MSVEGLVFACVEGLVFVCEAMVFILPRRRMS